MQRSTHISLALASIACASAAVAVPAAVATSRAKTVTIRIEGAKRTLLPQTTVTVPSRGSITKFGAPRGACPANSAAGVLNAATHGHWAGTWSSKYGDFTVTKILGDSEGFTKSYWEILINNTYAPAGECGLRLHDGDHLVFAAVSVTAVGLPLVLRAPVHAIPGHPFTVEVLDADAKGHLHRLAGAHVSGRGVSATTDANGIARITVSRAERLGLSAGDAGYVRAEATVKVS